MPIQKLVFRSEWAVPIGAEQTGVDVRMASPDRDAGSIEAVTEACRGGEGPSLASGGMPGELVSRPGRRMTTWLAFTHDRPIGLAAVVAAGDFPRIRHSIAWLLVSPDARRRGIGTALVIAAVTEALRAGAEEIWAETRADWPAAIAFWIAVGFRPPE